MLIVSSVKRALILFNSQTKEMSNGQCFKFKLNTDIPLENIIKNILSSCNVEEDTRFYEFNTKTITTNRYTFKIIILDVRPLQIWFQFLNKV